jgi:hypothetical protein
MTLRSVFLPLKQLPPTKNNTFWMVTKMVLIQSLSRKGVKIELLS